MVHIRHLFDQAQSQRQLPSSTVHSNTTSKTDKYVFILYTAQKRYSVIHDILDSRTTKLIAANKRRLVQRVVATPL